MNKINQYTQFMTPLGGIIAITSFFMPWLQIGVQANETTPRIWACSETECSLRLLSFRVW